MSTRAQRDKNRQTAAALRAKVLYECKRCGCRTFHGHFVPPSFGEEGFYICQPRVVVGIDLGSPAGDLGAKVVIVDGMIESIELTP